MANVQLDRRRRGVCAKRTEAGLRSSRRSCLTSPSPPPICRDPRRTAPDKPGDYDAAQRESNEDGGNSSCAARLEYWNKHKASEQRTTYWDPAGQSIDRQSNPEASKAQRSPHKDASLLHAGSDDGAVHVRPNV